MSNSLTDFFGEPIHVVTRADLLRDNALVDAAPLSREAGFKWPVALTAAAWLDCVTWPADDGLQDETGRLWDVLMCARIFALPGACTQAQQVGEGSQVFEVHRVATGRETPTPAALRLHVGPGDDGTPVVTIFLAGEPD